VSTKGSCAEADTNPLGKEPSNVHVATMGLYVVGDQFTRLVALGKVYDSASTIHNVPYADDVVRVSVLIVYDGDAQVPFPTSEIQFVRQALGTFVGWPSHLVKPAFDQVVSLPSECINFTHIVKSYVIKLGSLTVVFINHVGFTEACAETGWTC